MCSFYCLHWRLHCSSELAAVSRHGDTFLRTMHRNYIWTALVILGMCRVPVYQESTGAWIGEICLHFSARKHKQLSLCPALTNLHRSKCLK